MDKQSVNKGKKGIAAIAAAAVAFGLFAGAGGGLNRAEAADDLPAKLRTLEQEAWQARLFQLDDKIVIGQSVANIPNTDIKVGDDLYLGGFSSLTHVPGDPANVFYTSTDRGPNGDIDAAKCTGCKVFPIPKFTPRIVKIELLNGSIKVLEEIPLKLPGGALDPVTGTSFISGVSNFPDSVKTNLVGNGVPDEVPVGAIHYKPDGSIDTYETLPNDPYALDLEGIAYNPADDTFWMGEEYRPSLVQVKRDGTLVQRLVPNGEAALFANAPAMPIREILPAVFSTRNPNRGFESSAITPDGKYLFTAIQSPMINPIGTKPNANSRAARILKLDLSGPAPVVAGEYLYVLDAVAGVSNYISDLAALDERTLLVDERDANYDYKKIHRIDLTGATDILGKTDYIAPKPSAGSPEVPLSTLENSILTTVYATYTVKQPGSDPVVVTPAAKTLLLDTKTRGFPNSKLEGISMTNDHTLVVVNDNDFSVQDPDEEQAWMYTLSIPTETSATVASKPAGLAASVSGGTGSSKNIAVSATLGEDALLGTAIVRMPAGIAASVADTVYFGGGAGRHLRESEIKEAGGYILLDGIAMKAGQTIRLNLADKAWNRVSATFEMYIDSDGPEAAKSRSAVASATASEAPVIVPTNVPTATPTPTPTASPAATPTPTPSTAPAAGKPSFNDKVDSAALKAKIELALAKPQAPAFKDVPATGWSAGPVGLAARIGLAGGYPDGTFHPGDKVTRAEFAAMLVKALGLRSSGGATFADTKGHWAESAIAALKSAGAANGYGDGSFKPEQAVSRAETAAMLGQFLNLTGMNSRSSFADIQGNWAQTNIEALAGLGILNGMGNGRFEPSGSATRAESATMIVRTLNASLNLGLQL